MNEPSLRRGLGRAVFSVLIGLGALLSAAPQALSADALSFVAPPPKPKLAAVHTSAGAPDVLSAADALLYREIFYVQQSGDWAAAELLAADVDDPVLMGHVMAQRFLHPTKYRSKYPELKDWLAVYGDHPDAGQLYKLALKRRPADWKKPVQPVYGVRGAKHARGRGSAGLPYKAGLSRAERKLARQIIHSVNAALNKGMTLRAKSHLNEAAAKRVLSAPQYDKLASRLALAYFFDGHDAWSLNWSENAAKRSGVLVPQAHWTAGLVLWRGGDKVRASDHFAAAAHHQKEPWQRSAAAFWAARGYMLTGELDKVSALLETAAAHPRTFYGLLAVHVLGREMPFDWTVPGPEDMDASAASERPAGRRALALLQVGEIRRAEREIMGLLDPDDAAAARSALNLAAVSGMANLAMMLDRRLNGAGESLDIAAYPAPRWRPRGGFTVDPALLYALMRQESEFKPNAKSYRGASGLMQLMPATASFIARDRRLRSSRRNTLFIPETNMDLGQRYIHHLLNEPTIQGDVVRLAAAWNGGPGNLRKWLRRSENDDPLMLIESIPLRETRIFVERVLANLWIYRHRMGQESPTLAALAAGRAPVYAAQDAGLTQLAEDRAGN
ncbi:MAG: lytic transglycosylase domain-containing protein [Rhodospirillales bacterium]